MQNKEIQILLNTISTALQSNSVDEITSCISSATGIKKGGDSSLILHILQIVAIKYGLSIATILNTKSNRKVVAAKKVCYCVIHNVLGYPSRYIATDIFKMKHHNSVAIAILKYKQSNHKIKLEREFKNDIDEITSKVLLWQNNNINQ